MKELKLQAEFPKNVDLPDDFVKQLYQEITIFIFNQSGLKPEDYEMELKLDNKN